MPLGFTYDLEPRPEPFEFLAIGRESIPSPISGTDRTRWTGEPTTMNVPFFHTSRPLGSVSVPVSYWVPAAWTEVIERLIAHGIEMETLEAPRDVELDMYRLGEPQWAAEPFEGRLQVTAEPTALRRTEHLAPGSVRVPTDQPLGVLAVLLLEPSAPDSFFQWGFFNSIFQRTEYAEAYVLEPLAEQMLERDPALRQAFEQRLAEDPEFAADPTQRLTWFYERSPLVDDRWRLYPVGRELR